MSKLCLFVHGRFEMHLSARKSIWKSTFILAEVHNGNQTYAYSNTAFNVMNDYEFYSDQYAMEFFTSF